MPKSEGSPPVELAVEGRAIKISNPDRVYFPALGVTKLDLAHYYLSVGEGIVPASRERPCMLHRFPEGVEGEKVHQKRLPGGARTGWGQYGWTSPLAGMQTSSASRSWPV